MMSEKTLTKNQALVYAWTRGLLTYKLLPHQIPLYNSLVAGIDDPECLKYTLNAARRFGKSFVLCLIAISFALENPGSQIRFVAPTYKALNKITNPIFRIILSDCPPRLKPKFYKQENTWKFRNGSEIHLAGTDNGHAENLRGTASHLNLIDEAGFTTDLSYILGSILTPQTLTTGGTTLLASTPPKTPAHEFVAIAQECEARGHYSKYTIYDNSSLTQELIDLYAEESGGYESTTFRREYLAEFVVDEDSAIIPEWKDAFIAEYEIRPHSEYNHKYVAMDLGVSDFTAVLFGHYDFLDATLHIEDECTVNGPKLTTELLQQLIKNKEAELWGDKEVYKRVSDNNNLMLLNDLSSLHNLYFSPVTKTSLDAMVNRLRMFVMSGRLKINPKCKMLIGCLKYGLWDNKRKAFDRNPTYKHFDHLAALIYLVRVIDENTNPIPQTLGFNQQDHFIAPHLRTQVSENAKQINKAFKLR